MRDRAQTIRSARREGKRADAEGQDYALLAMISSAMFRGTGS